MGSPSEVWMVGDSYLADAKGAENVGVKAILVRSGFREDVKYYAKNLIDVTQIIGKEKGMTNGYQIG